MKDSIEPMDDDRRVEITGLLERHGSGEASAHDRLFALVYDDLRRIAGRMFRSQGKGATLQPTALVHEAWMRLSVGERGIGERQPFLAFAAHVMRHILIDHARAKRSLKRGGGGRMVTLDMSLLSANGSDADIHALGDSLARLAALKERHARVVELRVFAGMTIQETAQELGIGTTTVESDWNMARAWLRHELARERS